MSQRLSPEEKERRKKERHEQAMKLKEEREKAKKWESDEYIDYSADLKAFFNEMGLQPEKTGGVLLHYAISFINSEMRNRNNSKYVERAVVALEMKVFPDGRFTLTKAVPMPYPLAASTLRHWVNIKFEKQALSNGAIKYTPIGTMGSVDRYVFLNDKEDLRKNTTRTFTILGVTHRREYQTLPEFVGIEVKEHDRWANVPYYLVSDIAGNVGWISLERCLHIGLSYRFSNAQVRGSKIIPITPLNYAGPSRRFPELVYEDVSTTGFYLGSEAGGNNLNPLDLNPRSTCVAFFAGITYNPVLAKPDDVNPEEASGEDFIDVTTEMLALLRSVADISTNTLYHRMLFSAELDRKYKNTPVPKPTGTFLDRLEKDSCQRKQTIYRKALLWGRVRKSDYEYMQSVAKDAETLEGDVSTLSTAWNAMVRARSNSTGSKDRFFEVPAFQDMLGNMKPVDKILNIQIYSKFAPNVKTVYTKTLCSEPVVTEKLDQLLDGIPNAEFSGLKFRIKSPASLSEKVYERARLEGESTNKAIDELKDVLRYTILLRADKEVDTYVSSTKQFVLRAISVMEMIKFKNYWKIEDDPYQGINSAFKYMNANIAFEIQFHTKESFDLKNGKGHELYEITRSVDTPHEKRVEALKESFKLASDLYVPDGALTFEMKQYIRLPVSGTMADPVTLDAYLEEVKRKKAEQEAAAAKAESSNDTAEQPKDIVSDIQHVRHTPVNMSGPAPHSGAAMSEQEVVAAVAELTAKNKKK